jgi:LysM repeat protein
MEYVVKSGDSLSKIALAYGQPASAWRELHKSNPSIINPDKIYPGQILKIPDAWKSPGAAPTPPIVNPKTPTLSPLPGATIPTIQEDSKKLNLWIWGGAALAVWMFLRKRKRKK